MAGNRARRGKAQRIAFWRTIPVLALAALAAGCQTASSQAPDQALAAANTFRGTKPEVIRLAIRAIQSKGWKLDQVQESAGIVSFETTISMGSWSGVAANLILEEVAPGTIRVSGTAKQNVRGGQIAAFDIGGEAQGVVNQAISAMHSLRR
jgi:hypothetical protein